MGRIRTTEQARRLRATIKNERAFEVFQKDVRLKNSRMKVNILRRQLTEGNLPPIQRMLLEKELAYRAAEIEWLAALANPGVRS